MDLTPTDRPSFAGRFATLAALSYRVGYRLVGDRAEAEDLAQEALARAYISWRRIAAYDEAWVARVTVNLAIGRWRKHRRLVGDPGGRLRPEAGGDASGGRGGWGPPPGPDPLDRIELVAALRRLPRRQREVVTLRYLADRSEAEVAALLGCAPGTVKQHAHRGLAALRARLGHLHPAGRDTPGHTEEGEDSDVRASR